VIEVGENGGPPFLVRWDDHRDAALYFPGPAAFVIECEAPLRAG
jgi:hypothetical protein